jgi:RecB family exonuclease
MASAGQRTGLVAVSPSRLEAWDRCPRAYRYEHVDRLPVPEADQRQLQLGVAAHAILEAYLRRCVEARQPRLPGPLDALAQTLYADRRRPIPAGLWRQALHLVRPFLEDWAVPWPWVVDVERRYALDEAGQLADPSQPDVLVRGQLDLVIVQAGTATVIDWKSGWQVADEDELATGWAPGIYAAMVWAWASGLDHVRVEYWYLRTRQVRRVDICREAAQEALAWTRAASRRIAAALDAPDPDAAFPARPGRACATCPWALRCAAGQAALQALGTGPVASDSDARHLAGLYLAGEARQSRLRELLQDYLRDRPPLAITDDLAIGYWPTRGQLPPAQTLDLLRQAGLDDPWRALRVDNREIASLCRGRPGLEAALDRLRTPTAPWWGAKRLR